MKRLLLSIVVLCGLQVSAVADPVRAPSFWKNQRGSELRITAVRPDGTIAGTYINRAEGTHCKGTSYPVTGRTTIPRTVFRVNFTHCKSVATWTGTVEHWGWFPTEWKLLHNGQTTYGLDFFYRVN